MEENENKSVTDNVKDEPSETAGKTVYKKRNKTLVAIMLAFVLFITFFAGFFTGSCGNSSANKAKEIIKLIDKYAVTVDGDADKDEIARAIVNYVLADDKYAVYYSKEEYETILSQDKGIYAGIGVSFLVDKDNKPVGREVYEVTKNSPAYFAGIKAGDIITSATVLPDGEKKIFSDNSELFEFVSEVPELTDILFTVTRSGEFEDKEFTVQKAYYTMSYVDYYDNTDKLYFYAEPGSYDKHKYGITQKKVEEGGGISQLPDDTALIVFSGFEGDAADEFKTALDYMQEKGKTKLILDLRDNGGGFMSILSDIASYLIYNDGKKANPLAVAIDKDGDKTTFCTSRNKFYSNVKKMSVITNGYTASASECLIGALAYYGNKSGNIEFSRDMLVLTYNEDRGDYSTYGKGIMQTTYTLSTGGAFKLTTAYIYQPDGETCIHGKGITTDKEENRVADEDALSRAIEILK